jgi:CheY-like chemotaxis protein
MTDSHISGTAEGGPVNILMVDDRPGNLLGYQAILEELGENLLTADSARAALEVLLRNDVALLLVDVVMPDLDGFEFVDMIRTHPRFKRTPVIFVSGVDASEMTRLRGYSKGAVDYVSVPVVPEILRTKVRVFADLHRKTRQLERLNHEIATLVHDIRNPLAPILNCVRLLKSGLLDHAAVTRNQNLLEHQVLHLAQLVDELLEVSRSSRGPSTFRSAPTTHRFAAEIPYVEVGSVRVAEVMSTILDSAKKSSPADGRVRIGLTRDNEDVVLRIAPSRAEGSPVAPASRTTERKPRFLTVDDNVVHADTLTELLGFSGCQARATYSGEEAMRVGEELKPDVVLVDLVMPTMDGFEAAKRLRQTSWGSRAKLVAVTGWGLPSDRQKTADAGFDGHLEKPVDLDVVLKLLERVEI